MADTKMEETMEQEVENGSGDKAADSMETTVEACNENSDAKMETANAAGDEEEEEPEFADNEVYKNLRSQSVKPKVAVALIQLYESTEITPQDLDDRAIDMLRSFPTEQAIHVIEEVKKSNLLGVQNHAQFMMSLMRNFRDKVRQLGGASALTASLVTGPSYDSTKALLDRTGYSLEVTIGQRKYGGPPPDWDGPATGPAGNGHEIYIGRIPNDIYEDTLVPLFEEVGKIWDLRLMMDPITCKNRGYAFMTFFEKSFAAEASKKFDGHEILPGKKLKVNVSVANTRLFVGNIPKSKSKEEILAEFKELTDGVTDCIIYTSPDAGENRKNRGFCFLDFIDHKSASDAKRKIHSGKLRAFNHDLVVDWAEQLEEPDEETMAKVKVLYVRNLKDVVTEAQLKETFGVHGEIDHVKKIKDYAFVHFTERDPAIKALEALNGTELEGASMEVSLAKPQGDRKKNMRGRGRVFGSNRGGFNDYYGARGNTRNFGGGYGAQRSYGAPMDYGYGGYDPYSSYGVSSGYQDMYSYAGGYGGYAGDYSYGYGGGADPYSSYGGYGMQGGRGGRGGAMGGGGYSPRGGMGRGRGGGRGGTPRGGKRSADVAGGPASKREFGWGGM